jgi:hypothetical protein
MEKSIKNNSGVVRFAFKETNVNMEKDKKKEKQNNFFNYKLTQDTLTLLLILNPIIRSTLIIE